MTNMDKLYASVAANGPVCVGLDTEFSYLPPMWWTTPRLPVKMCGIQPPHY